MAVPEFIIAVCVVVWMVIATVFFAAALLKVCLVMFAKEKK